MGSFGIYDICGGYFESMKTWIWIGMVVRIDETGGMGIWIEVVWGREVVLGGEKDGTRGDWVWERLTTCFFMIFWKISFLVWIKGIGVEVFVVTTLLQIPWQPPKIYTLKTYEDSRFTDGCFTLWLVRVHCASLFGIRRWLFRILRLRWSHSIIIIRMTL